MSTNGCPAPKEMSTSTQQEITKIYTYNRNGKKQTVRRDYTIKGENKAKRADLEDYFEYDYNDKLNIKENYKAYNDTAEYPISYSMFYSNYRHYKNQN